MAKLITQLNRTLGNYQDVFIYTLNASFNGIEDTIENAQIKILFPSFLTVYLGDIQEPIKDVQQNVLDTGTLYTFNLGSISDLGIAIRIGIGVAFSPGTPSETSVTITPELWINNQLHLSYASETIQLIVNPRFLISHEQISPSAVAAPGGIVYYRILLKNYGDLGGIAAGLQITHTVPEGFQIDATYPILGKDISSNEYADLSQDGILGALSENTLTFSMAQFYGEAYSIIYRVILPDNLVIDNDYSTITTWTMDEVLQENVSSALPLSAPIHEATLSLYGPDYALPERLINYECYFSNVGNQLLDDFILTITLPQDIDFTSFTTGRFYLYGINEPIDLEYTISFSTLTGSSGTIGTFNTGTSTFISFDSLEDLKSTNDIFLTLNWEFPTFPVGFTTNTPPLLNGQIKNSIPMETILESQAKITYLANNISETNQSNCITQVADICVLIPTFSSSIGANPVRPGETFQYTLGANCRASRLSTPIFIMLLPKELMYIGNVQTSLYDYFNESLNAPISEPQIIPNFNENSDTLLLFTFASSSEIELNQKARLRFSFDVQVLSTARGEFSTFYLLDTINSDGIVSSNHQTYEDKNKALNAYTGNSNSVYAQSTMYFNSILFFVSISSRKEVKGFLDSDFINQNELANTLAGEEVYYRITLTNTGNADIDSIEFIDILPYVGDTGIIETQIPRESQFPLILTTEIFATLLSDANESATALDCNISYSQSTDPIRFGNQFDVIGSTDDWNDIVPESLSSTRAIQIKAFAQPLLPASSITILFKTIVPYGVAADDIAWNSFATDVTYTDTEGIQQHLLAIEPDKVGVKVVPIDDTKGRISGFVFWDEKKMGSYTDNSQRTEIVNDIGVVLYNQDGLPLRATFTSRTLNGMNGYYAFSNLERAQYYVRFFIDTGIHDFTVRNITSIDYSLANSNGVTPRINLVAHQYADNIIAGIHSNIDSRINGILKINRSSNQMIRNVIYDQMLIGMKLEDCLF